VTFTRGYADQLDGLLGKFLANDGVIASRTAGLNQSVKDIGSRRDALNKRLASMQASYTKQFSALKHHDEPDAVNQRCLDPAAG